MSNGQTNRVCADRCDFCGTPLREPSEARRVDRCPSCELYNAAVDAQQAAAKSIAEDRYPKAERAWLNSHGIYAFVDGKAIEVGTAEEAAPFAALTTAARKVSYAK